MADQLTQKQEMFCLAYIETGNATEAYRAAGYSTNATSKTINEAASRLLADSKVSARVAELRNMQVQRLAITVDDLVAELDEARTIALTAAKPQSAAAVSATLGKAKLLGLVTDKVEHSGGLRVVPVSETDERI